MIAAFVGMDLVGKELRGAGECRLSAGHDFAAFGLPEPGRFATDVAAQDRLDYDSNKYLFKVR